MRTRILTILSVCLLTGVVVEQCLAHCHPLPGDLYVQMTAKNVQGHVWQVVTLEGAVRSMPSGRPMAGYALRFEVEVVPGWGWSYVGSALTDAQGIARLRYQIRLQPGKYRYRVRSARCLSATQGVANLTVLW
jgi:hypothetical protein